MDDQAVQLLTSLSSPAVFINIGEFGGNRNHNRSLSTDGRSLISISSWPVKGSEMGSNACQRRRHHGFTLIELLMVIAIIGILISMLMPAVNSTRESARRTQCGSNLRQLAVAVLNFESAHGHLPPSATIHIEDTSAEADGSWGVHGRILPYLEENDVYQRVDTNTAWDYQAAVDRLLVPTFQCPSDPNASRLRDPGRNRSQLYSTCFGFNLGTWLIYDFVNQQYGNGVFYPESNLPLAEIKDGSRRTLVAAEV